MQIQFTEWDDYILSQCENEEYLFLFESSLSDGSDKSTYIFKNPAASLEFDSFFELKKYVSSCSSHRMQVFAVPYEFGYASYPERTERYKTDLIRVFEFDRVEEISFEKRRKMHSIFTEQTEFPFDSRIVSECRKTDYTEKIKSILREIQEGFVYQVNFSFPLKFEIAEGTEYPLYSVLRRFQPTDYNAFYKMKNKFILSLSPELLFEEKGRTAVMRPMKGTASLQEARSMIHEKHKAENFMIVDLLRNDLGRVCEFGSVRINNLLQIENYRLISQLTSEIEGKIRKDSDLCDLLQAVFPSGSVTGAPKLEAMKVIDRLESSARGIYTGALGFNNLKKRVFSVAIRTVEVTEGRCRYRTGSGIVYDSVPEMEYEECFLKAGILFKALDLRFFESVLFRKGRFILLNDHFERLRKSFRLFFGEDLSFEKDFLPFLNEKVKFLNNKLDYKIRIEISGSRKVRTLSEEVIIRKGKTDLKKICLSETKVSSFEIMLQHKTNHRQFYDQMLSEVREKGFFESVFLNEKDEITEGCFTNIFCRIDGIYYTPPSDSGLLAGVFRDRLLKRFPKIFRQRKLYIQDMISSDSIFICNSVRGIIRVRYE